MLGGVSFYTRVAVLAGLMIVAGAVDVWQRGQDAVRPREYLFICAAAVLGGVVGFGNDCVTSAISPDYFIVGKELEGGSGIRWRAGELGFQSGLSAGAIGGALCLFLRPKRLDFSWRECSELLYRLWIPAAAAMMCGAMASLLAGQADPMRFSASLAPLMSAEQLVKFTEVWWIHTGLYVGLGIGLFVIISQQWRKPPDPR